MRYLYIIILILISLVCTAQDYPRLAVIESDTLALLTVPQLKVINEKLIDLDEERERVKALSDQIKIYESMNKSLNEQLRVRDEQSIIMKETIKNYETSLNLYDEELNKYRVRSLIISGIGISIGISGILFFIFD